MDDMTKDVIESATFCVSGPAFSKAGTRLLDAGSVIASCVGNFGIASINSVPVVINQQLQAFVPRKVLPEYLQLIVRSSAAYFEMIATAATLVYINQTGFANLPIPLPTTHEQREIIDFVKSESAKTDNLLNSYFHQLTLLTEYRAALINECVTGQREV